MNLKSTQPAVLFVCLGNICRSPAAEAIFRHYVENHGHGDEITVDSAGTAAYHVGEPADQRMRERAANRGYAIESMARQFDVVDFQRFDLVVAMDHENYDTLASLAGAAEHRIRLFGSFLPGVEATQQAPAVPDPYYGGLDGFNHVVDIIEDGCPRLLDYVVSLAKGS